MTSAPWEENEVGEARLDVVALLRAELGGDREGIAIILDGAGDRATRCIAETLLGMAADTVTRLTAATIIIGDGPALDAVLGPDMADLLADPTIRAIAERSVAASQAAIIKGE